MYYPCCENKGTDQLRGYREPDLRLCFRICKMPVFSRRGSYFLVTKLTESFNCCSFQSFDSFKIKCRCLTTNESYPIPDVEFLVEDSVPVDNGGCFRKGPGLVQSFTGELTFNTSLMQVGNRYEIVVYGYKDTRESSAVAYLEILAADPPNMTIA